MHSLSDVAGASVFVPPHSRVHLQYEGGRAFIKPDTALHRINSPGRYDLSSPDGTPVSSLELVAATSFPWAGSGKSLEASPLGAEDNATTPVSSVGLGSRVAPIWGVLSESSDGQAPKETAVDGSASDVESIRLSKASAHPTHAQIQPDPVLGDSDSGARGAPPCLPSRHSIKQPSGELKGLIHTVALAPCECEALQREAKIKSPQCTPLFTRGLTTPGSRKSTASCTAFVVGGQLDLRPILCPPPC